MATHELPPTHPTLQRPPLMDPDAVRKVYEGMHIDWLCSMLLGLSTDAHQAHHNGNADSYGFAIDRIAILVDVMSGRLPDVGTDGDDDGLDTLRDLMPGER